MFNLFKRKKEDVKLFYHTDVHCHILPGVDHGSQNVEQSLAMLEAEKSMGIDRVICTSHVTAETFENTPESLTAAYEVLKKAVDEAGLDIEIHASAEYRIDEYWNKEYAAGHILPMPGNYLLLENSFHQELLELDEMLFDLQVKGYKPILAHPERYSYYSRRRQRYEKLHSMGVKFQINILSLTGYFGAGARDNVLWLIKNKMVDMLGSDMHNLDHAQIIKDYLRTKDWHKQSELIKERILNDIVC
ncbi:MAG TPA: hypothetical protein DCQ56_03045 [Porphyromonadaceae bacterium]|nr:hypothetical protein [Porphyromonadaceae bacterium]